MRAPAVHGAFEYETTMPDSQNVRERAPRKPSNSGVSKKPAILFVDHTTLPGGAELALPRIARHTTANLSFLFLEPAHEALAFPDETSVSGPRSHLRPTAQLRFLRQQLRSGGYDAVVSNTLRAAVLVALVNRGTPHILYLQDGADSNSLSLAKRLLLRFLVLPRVSRVFTNSSWTSWSLGTRHSSKIAPPVFSPSGVVVRSQLASNNPKDDEQSQHAPLRLLSLSRVVEWKGLHVVLEALEILRNTIDADAVTFTIAGANLMGPDDYLRNLKTRAERLPFDIRFVGHQDDVASLLTNHDVLVHASVRPEPFGQVIVQGLAAGLAVIASNDGGPAEILRDGISGLLHEPGNAADLAAKIQLLVHEPALRRQIAEEGLVRASQFTDAVVVAKLDVQLASAVAQGE